MGALVGDSELLALWEAGASEHPLDRATLFVSWVGGVSREAAANMSLDARDRTLFQFCQTCFGANIDVVLVCEECGVESDVVFSVLDVLSVERPGHEFSIAFDGRHVPCRLPDSRDLARAIASQTPRETLLARLIDQQHVDERLLDEIEQEVAKRGGLAAFSIANTCPNCAHVSDAPFDILDYLWRKVSERARGLLRDIDTLARAYGWSSADILALSPLRRAMHLAMVQS